MTSSFTEVLICLLLICGIIIMLGGKRLIIGVLTVMFGGLFRCLGCLVLALLLPCIIALFLTREEHDWKPYDWGSIVFNYAPVFYFHPAERFFPLGVEWIDGKATLVRGYSLQPDQQIGPASLKALPIGSGSGDYYLNFDHNAMWSTDFWAGSGLTHTVYAHIVVHSQPHSVRVVVQYWLFYVFNDAPVDTFDHQGDWEMVQIVLEGYSVKSLHANSIIYYQHGHPVKRLWSDPSVSKVNVSHPVVWVALGTHAAYFTPGNYSWEFLGEITAITDTTAWSPAAAKKLLPQGLTLPTDKMSRAYKIHMLSHENWLDYEGYWGSTKRPFSISNSPRGPKQHKEWFNP